MYPTDPSSPEGDGTTLAVIRAMTCILDGLLKDLRLALQILDEMKNGTDPDERRRARRERVELREALKQLRAILQPVVDGFQDYEPPSVSVPVSRPPEPSIREARSD